MPLWEYIRGGTEKLTVDREAGIIRNVKVLGLESVSHGRVYLREAVHRAAKLYEGCKVYTDHNMTPGKHRSVRELFGKLINIKPTDDGLRGDLQILTTHEIAESVLEDAEKGLDLFGLSHNADGRGDFRNGVQTIREIVHVVSVDLVTDPATTKSLRESQEAPTMKTISSIFEAILPNLDAKKRAGLTALLEMDDMKPVVATEIDEPPAEASADDQMKAAFRGMVVAAFDDESLDAKATLQKIKEILTAQEKLMGGSAAAAEEEEPAEEEPKPAQESRNMGIHRVPNTDIDELREELKQLKEEKAVLRLIASEGLTFAKTETQDAFVEALIPLSAPSRKAMIEDRKSLMESKPAGQGFTGAKSQGRTASTGTTEVKFPETYEEAKRLLHA